MTPQNAYLAATAERARRSSVRAAVLASDLAVGAAAVANEQSFFSAHDLVTDAEALCDAARTLLHDAEKILNVTQNAAILEKNKNAGSPYSR